MTSIPVQITFRGLLHSDALEAEIREHVASFERFGSRVTDCRVLVEMPHRHRHDGRHFHVRIELAMPGSAPIVVSHEPALHGPLNDIEEGTDRMARAIDGAHQHAVVAVRHAFDTARRLLDDARQRREA